MRVLVSLVSLVIVVLTARSDSAQACAIVGDGKTSVKNEDVLIVWDAAAKTEHLVRKLSFSSDAEDFGFLVPTPSRPELAEVDSYVFTELSRVYRAKNPQNLFGPGGLGAASPSTRPSVQVVAAQNVAGLDATIIKASDATALNEWLAAHGYPSSASLVRYLEPYVAKGYFVTAFRYVAHGSAIGTRALRMSFATDKPYFPYAEPDDAPNVPARRFRLSVIANERVTGRLGNAAWLGRTAFAARDVLPADMLKGVVPSGVTGARWWVTTFDEDASVRGRADLWFVRAKKQTPVASTIHESVD